ncbi:MAG: FAD:protein FMN transferase [Tyzzerella sp.]|nr:FAD:protein FMN transferase [Tyzzerella sp.]
MKKLRVLYAFILCSMLLCGCSFQTSEPISRTAIYFDTVISIKIYDSQDETLLDQCFAFCEEFENTISRTIETSEISQINNSKGTPVTVSDTTIELLEQGIYYGELTNGAFDITIAPLSELWDFKNNPGVVPEDADIQDALSHVSYKNIIIDGNTVTLTDPEMAIDLGGIAKGYMADRLKEYLLIEGVESALIDLGGNILAVGSKPNGNDFTIGIKKPFEESKMIATESISDLSVVTSGCYERYFEVDGELYHHILNTETGYPCDNGLLGVTILSEKSVDGDALSTSCFALGLEEGKKLIETLNGIEAIFITDDYKIIDTRM